MKRLFYPAICVIAMFSTLLAGSASAYPAVNTPESIIISPAQGGATGTSLEAGADKASFSLGWGVGTGVQSNAADNGTMPRMGSMTIAERKAAAARVAALRAASSSQANNQAKALLVPTPGGVPDYFGIYPNWALSPLPALNTGNGAITGGIRKFVDSLPGLGPTGVNNIGQFVPVGYPDKITYPGSDYYEISLQQYTEQMHSDLPPTTLRGYVQTNNGTNDITNLNTVVPSPIHQLGPVIVANKDRPVRIKFTNNLPVGNGGDLFIPVDTTAMGAGIGPNGGTELYTENRATLHLHGGITPWISDGTPHQWITPATETTSYPKGVSVSNVPDMPDPGPGSMTFFYSNQQSARLMFYHDHAYGLTRLNVYAGEAAGYLIRDLTEQKLINGGTIGATLVAAGTIPANEIPLIIQDKSFVPGPAALAAQDPTWDTVKYGGLGNLWFPHVYMPNQNPSDAAGANAMGRWDYGPWFWPPLGALTNPEVPNPYYPGPGENPTIPGTPNPSIVPEGFMDTPVINGTAYPYLTVAPQAYRFRILNASNDRFVNLQLYYADTSPVMVSSIVVTNGGSGYTTPPIVSFTGGGTGAAGIATVTGGVVTDVALTFRGSGYTSAPMVVLTGGGGAAAAATALTTTAGLGKEVKMVPALPGTGLPASWPSDARNGGVPDPASAGPAFIQIGTEGGFLPAPVVIDPQPVDYVYDRRNIVVLNVSSHALFLAPAERADVIIDFSQVPPGSKLILYNDSPAPVPASDPRVDYYTGNPDYTSTGGAPSTLPGYGPNTRTLMQIQVGIVPLSGSPLNSVTVTNGGTGYTSVPAVAIAGGGGTGATANATANVGAIAITSGGSGYTSAPTVTLTGGGAGATANATIGGPIASLAITAAGSGYSAPTAAITGGGGSGATVNATGGVSAITMVSPGIGYTAPPTVTISGGGGTGATATASTNTVLGSITINTPGSGYTAPTVAFSGGGGAGAAATLNGVVSGLAVTAGGSGYAAPVISLTGGGGSGATASVNGVTLTGIGVTAGGSGYRTPVVNIAGGGGALASVNGTVTGITVVAAGSGYSASATAVLAGGGGAGATANVTVTAGIVTGFVITNPGSGYTSAPAVTINDATGVGATAAATLTISGIILTNPGAGYLTPPAVTVTDTAPGTGSGATARALVAITGMTLTNPGSGYTSAPSVVFTGGTGAGATAKATISVTGATLTNPGSGYSSNPTATISDTAPGTGAGATATATISGVGAISVAVTNPGTGYTSAPSVVFSGGGGAGATATAKLLINGLTLSNPGSGYTSVPTVTITDTAPGTGAGATGTATLGTIAVTNITIVTAGTGYTTPPTVNFAGGGGGVGAAATATLKVSGVTLLTAGTAYTTPPTVTFTGGGGNGAAATANIIPVSGPVFNLAALNTAIAAAFTASQHPIIVPQAAYGPFPDTAATIQATAMSFTNGAIGSIEMTRGGSGYTSAPTVTISGGGGGGATATAAIRGVNSVTIVNKGTGYSANPTVSFSGGGGTGVTATATVISGVIYGIKIVNPGNGYTSAPTVTISDATGTGATATAVVTPGSVSSIRITNGGSGYTSAPTVAFTGGGGTGAAAVASGVLIQMAPKAIQELFTTDYGRMNATLGVEVPFTSSITQTTIPYGYIDPPTEILQDNITAISPVQGDGTQIWKITHNGVDTHVIHFHLFDVQIVNRVGWDGAIRMPDANELGWKESVRMNPLEDCIVALRPIAPKLPFGVPNSTRPYDITTPIGSAMGFTNVDQNGNPVTVLNQLYNYFWEYVWHCHILGHEENDMMRPIVFQVQTSIPAAPSLTYSIIAGKANLSWTDATLASNPATLGNPANEIGFLIQRAPVTNGNTGTYVTITTGLANSTTYIDPTPVTGTVKYRVVAFNAAGNSTSNSISASAPPAVPVLTAPANGAVITTLTPTLTWNASVGATSYTVQVSTSAAFTSTVVNQTQSSTTYTVGNGVLSGSTVYYWRVNATNNAGSSAWATARTFTTSAVPPPNAPTGLFASAISTTQINLSWTNSAGVNPVEVWRRTGTNGTYTLINTTAAGATTYNNSGLTAATTYYYYVKATNASGASPASNVATATTQSVVVVTVPAAPALTSPVGGVLVPNTQPTMNWAASTGATSYTVQISTSAAFTTLAVNIRGLATPTYNVPFGRLVTGTTYYWRVSATNSAGTSIWSTTGSFRT